MTKVSKPIKRDPALVEFSRDHHFGLLLVWKIRHGLRTGIAPVRISRYVSCLFVADLAPHFADEEAYLFTQLSPSDPMRLRAEQEHAELRLLADTIRKNLSDAEALLAFAKLLEAHIRFEERELFARLQESLSSEQLLQLLGDVPARPHLNDADWDDAFWAPNGQTRKETSHAG